MPKFLRKNDKAIKIDENTNFKTSKWQAGIAFGAAAQFKDAIAMFVVF